MSKPISVVELQIKGYEGLYKYYKFQIPASSGSQTRTFLLSYALSLRLWSKYVQNVAQNVSIVTPLVFNSAAGSSKPSSLQIPGQSCSSFWRTVWKSLELKRRQGDILTSWIVTPSLYMLWARTSRVSTELFADCFNESGVLSAYCSKDVSDKAFIALGCWEDHENLIQGGAGNPPFDVELISSIVRRFEMGVKGSSPYCRLVILPLGKRYKLTSHIKSLTSEGELLVSARPGSFPFMNEQVLLSNDHHKPKPSKYQSVGIFVWCNIEYLLKYSPPVDIEGLYQVWIDANLYTPEDFILHNDAFIRAFPPELRCSESVIDVYKHEPSYSL